MMVLDDPRDPLPPEVCLMCSRHWTRCTCDPDDPDMHRRIAIERALRAGDDALAQALICDSQIDSAPAATEAHRRPNMQTLAQTTENINPRPSRSDIQLRLESALEQLPQVFDSDDMLADALVILDGSSLDMEPGDSVDDRVAEVLLSDAGLLSEEVPDLVGLTLRVGETPFGVYVVSREQYAGRIRIDYAAAKFARHSVLEWASWLRHRSGTVPVLLTSYRYFFGARRVRL